MIAMKNFIMIIMVLLFSFTSLNAEEIDLEGLYCQLDDAIAHSSDYVAAREHRIASLKQRLNTTGDKKTKLQIYYNLYNEYKSYVNDSAMMCMKQCISLAEDTRQRNKKAEYQCLTVLQASTAGYYPEALSVLSSIRREDLDSQGLHTYYKAINHLYGELGFYSNDSEMRQEFYRKSNVYRDSIYKLFSPDDFLYIHKKEDQLISSKLYQEALRLNDKWMKQTRAGTPEYAMVTYYRQQIYNLLGVKDMAKYWLAKSAITDVHNAIMDQASLWTLADQLSKDGDTERSFNYITFAWKASQTFGTRIRSWLISPILSSIDNSYQKRMNDNNRRLVFFIVAVSLLAVLLVLLLFYVNKQRGKIASARNALKTANDELERINNELSSANKELENTNLKLDESNRVKEEYIGRFIGMCSLYIDKMDEYRRKVNKLVRNRNYSELAEFTNTAEFKDKEMDELYSNFDAVFLHLFPSFVEDFNLLLNEPSRIHLTDSKRLNTILRVFALIRLGIDDSTKISEFLNYSVNTIYNYRAKMRNAAIGDRDDFEKKVKALGTLKTYGAQDGPF